MKTLFLVLTCILANAGITNAQLASTSTRQQHHEYGCTDENCTHTNLNDTVPAFSMYYFPDSTSTDVINISVEPVVNSPEAVAYHQLHGKIASKAQGSSLKKLEDTVMTAEEFISTMNILNVEDPLSHIPVQVQVNTSKTIGSIPIVSSVSPIGGVTYNMPVACTPGRNGHQPAIGVSYNSSGGNGILGFGWNISGLSAISRTPQNIHYNGKVEPIQMNANDIFILDGTRLLQRSGSTTEFETELGDIRVKAINFGSVVKYFEVSYPNGNTARFGDSGNATNQLYYPIRELTDILGNKITFNYTFTDNQYYIDNIEYGSNSVSPTNFGKIIFNYLTTRPDPYFSYEKGLRIGENRLLNKITTYSNSDVLHTYTFTYVTDKVSLLDQISCDNLNPLKFYYGYNNNRSSTLGKAESTLMSYFASGIPVIVNKGKFDYGNDDDALIIYPRKNNMVRYTSGTKSHYYTEYHPDQALLVYQSMRDDFPLPVSGMKAEDGFMMLTSADIDGKPGEEVIKILNTVVGGKDRVTFKVYKPNIYSGLHLDTVRYYDLNDRVKHNSGSEDSLWPKSYFSGDFDGDGRMEIFCVSMDAPLGQTDKKSKCTLIDLQNNIKRYDAHVFNYDIFNDVIIPIDFDGDGKTDIAHVNSSGMNLYSFAVSGSTYTLSLKATYTGIKSVDFRIKNVLLGNINPDGKIDILVSPYKSYYVTQYYRVPVWAPRYCGNCGLEYPIIDEYSYNCRHCNTSVQPERYCIECYYSLSSYCNDGSHSYNGCCSYHGSSVSMSMQEYVDNGNVWTVHYGTGGSTPFAAQEQTFINAEQNDVFMTQDVNQDGTLDIVQKKGSLVYVYLTRNSSLSNSYTDRMYNYLSSSSANVVGSSVAKNNYHSFLIGIYNEKVSKIYANRIDGKQRLLTGSVNSNGVIQRIYYNQLNDEYDYMNPVPYIYTNGYGATFPNENFIGPLWVTSMQESYLNGNKMEAQSYSYYNAVVNRQGLGFRGFEKVTVYDQIRGRTSEKTLDPLNYGIPVKDVNHFSEVTYSATATLASNKKLTIRINSLTSLNKLTGATVTNSYLYDTYNNVTKETVNYGGGVTAVTDQTYNNSVSGSSYIIGQPLTRTVTNTRSGSSWIDRETYTYNTASLPLTRITHTGTDGNNKTGETKWRYDAHGNITSEKSAPYNVTEFLGDSIVYDTQGRYITSVLNTLGQKTTYSNYDKYGNARTDKDYKDRTTTRNYDEWGRLTSVVYPEGVTETTNTSWGGTGLFTVTKTVTGSPDAITHYDALGREMRSANQRFDNQWQYVDIEYDSYGRSYKTSLPFKGTSATQWNNYAYDNYDRPTKITEASGKITSWSYSGLSYTETKNGMATTKTTDASGALVSVLNPGGAITYTLRPDGQPSSITAPGGVVTSFEYDIFGRQTALVDPSAGRQTSAYSYTTAGVLTLTETNPKGTNISVFDKYGRITSLQRQGEFSTTYGYSEDGLLANETSTNGTSTTFTYDTYDKPLTVKETVPDSKWLQKTIAYSGGNVSSVQYVSQSGTLGTENFVYTNGHNTEIKLNGSTTIWKLTGENDLGQPTASTTGDMNRTYTYNAYGIPTGRTAGSIQNFSYSFDVQKGNLLNRTDNIRSKTESFGYDALNRLTSAAGKAITYVDNGNITRIEGVGTMTYGNTEKPYQVTMLSPEGTAVPLHNQSISYTSFQRPSRIDENGLSASFTYNAAGNRVKVYVANGTTPVLTRYYIGGQYELDTQTDTERLYLGGDTYSAPAVYVKEAGNWKFYYICRDYLGSITHIADTNGEKLYEYSYDSWGRLRNPETQVVYTPGSEPALFLGRGYTGHEHLPWFGLINMNARLYDPALGRFLSPDPYVQAPDFSQNFNRYSYCLNNPLMYVDEDGEFWHIVIGAIVGGVGNLIANWNNVDGFWDGLTTFAIGAGAGAVTAATGGAGAGVWAVAGVSAGGGALVAANNDILSQTGKNFSGFNNVNWEQVGKSTFIGGVSSFAGGSAGYWAANSSVLINNINSPILRSAVVSPLVSGASHIAGGTTAGLLSGQDLGTAFNNSFNGLDANMALGGAIGVASTIGASYAKGVSPWTGKTLNSYSSKELTNYFEGANYSEKVLQQMNEDSFHGFPESVKTFQLDGYITPVIGGDGVGRTQLHIPGSYKGYNGEFLFLKESNGIINHRIFKPYVK